MVSHLDGRVQSGPYEAEINVDDKVGTVEQNVPQRNPLCPAVDSGTAFSRRLKQLASIFGATGCLVLAVLGFFLPLLPCTPFVLLASFLLVKSSPSMHRRLRASKFFGRILVDWEDRKGIRPADKVRAIIVVIASLLISIYAADPSTQVKFLILFFVTIGLWVIVRLPLAHDNDPRND